MQLDPWRAPTGRVQDCRVCHRRRQWTIRVPFHDRYNDDSAHKGDKDILPMVSKCTNTFLLIKETRTFFPWKVQIDFYCLWQVRTFLPKQKDISAHGKYLYNRISTHDRVKSETYMDIYVHDRYNNIIADDR